MRVTNSMMIANMMRNIGRNLNSMDKLDQSMSTGKKFSKPSEDPIGVSRSLRLNTDVATMEQYKRNVDDAGSWMTTTEIATNNIIDILQRARELTVQAANGSNSVDERKAISSEIEQLKQQLINIGNTSYSGRYIFSGYKTDQPLLKSDGTYDLGGGSLNYNETINFNIGIGDRIGINTVGQRVFGYMIDNADLDKAVSTGGIDNILKADNPYPGGGYTVLAAPNNNMDFSYNGTNYSIALAPGAYAGAGNMITQINTQLNANPALNGHVEAKLEDGRISIISDKAFVLQNTSEATLTAALGFPAATMPRTAVKSTYALEGAVIDLSVASNQFTVTAGVNDRLTVNYNGTDYPITLTAAAYNNSPLTLDSFTADLQAQINANAALRGHVTVTNVNNRLIVNSDNAVALKTAAANPFDITDMGMINGKTSSALDNKVDSGAKTQLIGVFDQLIADLSSTNDAGIRTAITRIDIHMNNINGIRAEIGVKSNRVDLTSNRIDDDTINLKDLLSKNEDADMAEVIMNYKMQENVYNASLSTGAKIIQPSLVDFLR